MTDDQTESSVTPRTRRNNRNNDARVASSTAGKKRTYRWKYNAVSALRRSRKTIKVFFFFFVAYAKKYYIMTCVHGRGIVGPVGDEQRRGGSAKSSKSAVGTG